MKPSANFNLKVVVRGIGPVGYQEMTMMAQLKTLSLASHYSVHVLRLRLRVTGIDHSD